MKVDSFGKWSLVAAIALLGAALACSAPAVQSDVTPSAAVGEAFTVTPGAVTLTPEVLVVTATTEPSGGSTATTDPGASASGVTPTSDASCLYNSVYLDDLTIPDGTEIQTGTGFTKTWRVQNNGCQTWPSGTTLVYVSGNQMSGPASVAVPETAPKGTQDISVDLTAPNSEGTYQAYWQLRTPNGIQFGDKIFVKIVAKAAAAPAVPTKHLAIPGGIKVIPSATPTLVLVPLVPDVPILPLLHADFTVSYKGAKASCAGPGTDYWVLVKNTGSIKLESVWTKFEAPPGTQKDTGSNNDPFAGSRTCSGWTGSVAADSSAYLVGGSVGPAIASGTAAKITIKLCGLDNLGGTCATKTVTFTTD